MGQDIAELPPKPRCRDLSFYLVLLLLVAPVWSAVPLSWGFVLYTVKFGGQRAWLSSWQGQSLLVLALGEVCI